MIKNFTPQPFMKSNPLPNYVSDVRQYTLTGEIAGGYEITLAKLSIGDSVSLGKPLIHALFKSYTDHGKRMSEARTRVSGCEREFVAVKNAMFATGFDFNPTTPCTIEEIMYALGEYFKSRNPDIQDFKLVSQICH